MPHPLIRQFPILYAADGGFPGIPGGDGSSGIPGFSGGGSQGGAQPPAPAPGTGPVGEPAFMRPEPPVGGPVGGPVTFELAGWGSRFGAWILDAIIIGVLFIPCLLIAGGIGLDLGTSSASSSSVNFSARDGQFLGIIAIYLLLVLLYAPLTMAKMQGSTPGKRIVGIRVVRADGQPVTFGYAVLREWVIKGIVLGIAQSVTFGLAFLVNYLWPLWDSENRALHDMAARSRVVRR
jgi:uncharacterized RDD family membrane protein YckC